MEQLARGKVTGFKWFKGKIDGGDEIDSGTVFVESVLRGKDSKGYASQPFKCTGSSVVKAIAHNEFPLYCELALESTTDGKGAAQQVCSEIRPLKPGDVGHPGQPAQQKKAA